MRPSRGPTLYASKHCLGVRSSSLQKSGVSGTHTSRLHVTCKESHALALFSTALRLARNRVYARPLRRSRLGDGLS